MNVKYKIYNPAGNITALVIGDKYSIEQRKLINDKIMKIESKVEQVGFVSEENSRLTMAGGEFCGNATRCATLYYIKKQKNIELEINDRVIKSGIDECENVWCEIPIEEYKMYKLNKDIYKVLLKGITILVIKNIENYKDLKEKAKEIIKYYNIDDAAVGVMFVNKTEEYIKIYPIVWVKEIDTLFLENACGSGTIAVTMLESCLTGKNNKYRVMQPSGEFLETEITIKNSLITRAILKGKIETDNLTKEMTINTI